MPLINCPDCERQISDRADACPFCGCPSRFYFIANSEKNEIKQNNISDKENKQLSEKLANQVEKKNNNIEFKFGKFVVSYPEEMATYASLYGEYCRIADEYYDKYIEVYNSMGNMYAVLTKLTEQAENDLYLIVDKAVKDLYSHGIVITSDDFIKEYEIDFKNEIESLFEQYVAIQEEKDDLEYKRKLKKANRGKWQGGGFGIKGAIKGAATAGLLNAGSGLLHSIGDGISKSSDNWYINNKLEAIYNDSDNREEFASSVYVCVFEIVYGIKQAFINNNYINEECFKDNDEISSLYETTTKYEKDSNIFLQNMIMCFSMEPELERYYLPIIDDLFSEGYELEQFLSFWNLEYIYKKLEKYYIEKVNIEDNNLFINNRCSLAIKIVDDLKDVSGNISIRGRIIKGNPQVGQNIVFVQGEVYPLLATNIIEILDDGKAINETKIGKTYTFVLKVKNKSYISDIAFLVDNNSFEMQESSLYANYCLDKEEVLWGFDEATTKEKIYLYTFVKEDKYISNRGIGFSSTLEDVKKAYGNNSEFVYDGDNDVVNSIGVKKGLSYTKILSEAKKYLAYGFGKRYVMRFYFNKDNQMILVAYLKDLDMSQEGKEGEKMEVKQACDIQWKIECSNCGQLMDRNNKFCNFCGERNILQLIECPFCGNKIKKDTKFCNYCGNKL